jgi:hypothetical protein
MAAEQKKVRTCDACGAAIQREDFLSHRAGRYKGRLLCPNCIDALKTRLASVKEEEPVNERPQPDDAPIALVELDDDKPHVGGAPSDQIRGFTGGEMIAKRVEREYNRPLLRNTPSATRCRTFHCKMTDASFQNLNEQINEWLDEREEVEIKFALSNIGVVEGKHADPHLIITIFY